MLKCVTARTGVVPRESFVDIGRAAYIVSRGIAVASQDIDKSSADAFHVGSAMAFLAPAKNFEELGRERSESIPKYADFALFELSADRRNCGPTSPRADGVRRAGTHSP